MEQERANYPVATMCRVLDVSVSGYYEWRQRQPSERELSDRELTERIRKIHYNSRGTYGAPRVHAELRKQGLSCSRKWIARLMREADLEGCHRRRKVKTTRRGSEPAASDLVGRNFRATGPNLLWEADITYIPTLAGFLYLAVVLDAFSRRVVGWAMARGPGDGASAAPAPSRV